MNYTLAPSLEHRALVLIVTTLWNQDDIRALIANYCFPVFYIERTEKWQEIENKVVEKVPQLSQPKLLKEKILGAIKPIGLQILTWIEYNRNILYGSDVKKNFRLFWTPQGTLDKKKTTEALVKDERLNIATRYQIACFYCLEDYIPELWNKIPEDRREYFYSEEDPKNVGQQQLVVLWTYVVKGEIDKLDNLILERWHTNCSPYQFAFELAGFVNNVVAIQYFWQKLTSREREESLVRTAVSLLYKRYVPDNSFNYPLKENYADVLCFLLSQMDEKQQMQVFRSYPFKVLKCLLAWPFQSFFMKTANRMRDFLLGKDCHSFLRQMVIKVKQGHKDYDYQKLFVEFFRQSSDAQKSYVIDSFTGDNANLLSKLLEIR